MVASWKQRFCVNWIVFTIRCKSWVAIYSDTLGPKVQVIIEIASSIQWSYNEEKGENSLHPIALRADFDREKKSPFSKASGPFRYFEYRGAKNTILLESISIMGF